MPLYEGVFIARQDLSSTQVDQLADRMTDVLREGGGGVAKKEYWGLKNLAYRIKKNRKGHYVMFHIDAPSAAVQEMERQLRINEDVLRYMTVRVEKLEEGPSAMMQAKSSRDDRRGGRGGRGGDRDRDGPREGRGDRDRGPRGDRDRDGPRDGRGNREPRVDRVDAARTVPTPTETAGHKSDAKIQ